jgi:hypothetical protein
MQLFSETLSDAISDVMRQCELAQFRDDPDCSIALAT